MPSVGVPTIVHEVGGRRAAAPATEYFVPESVIAPSSVIGFCSPRLPRSWEKREREKRNRENAKRYAVRGVLRQDGDGARFIIRSFSGFKYTTFFRSVQLILVLTYICSQNVTNKRRGLET